jgi:hypothetical protein
MLVAVIRWRLEALIAHLDGENIIGQHLMDHDSA